MKRGRKLACCAGAALWMWSCGGNSPSGPSPGGGSSSGATITLTAAGVNPKQLTVAPGTRVLFTNNDSQSHMMDSDPHPEHTDCPEINNVGFLTPNQSKETGNLNAIRTCGYHDHNAPEDTRWRGQIIIR